MIQEVQFGLIRYKNIVQWFIILCDGILQLWKAFVITFVVLVFEPDWTLFWSVAKWHKMFVPYLMGAPRSRVSIQIGPKL